MNTCQNNHPLVWSAEVAEFSGGVFSCNNCKESSSAEAGRWRCNECDYDICSKCKPAPPPNTYCSKGHKLGWALDKTDCPSGTFKCKKCGKTDQCEGGRWTCCCCKEHICSGCRDPPMPYIYCMKGHCLKVETEPVEFAGPNYKCNACEDMKSYEKPRWRCKDCDYDVCLDCRSLPYRTCANAHPLYWSYDGEKYPDGFFNCDGCTKRAPVEEGRWSCPACTYDICTDCREAKANLKCKENGLLVWSTDASKYPGGSFSCDKCKSSAECENGRWNCNECGYDLCSKCRAPDTCYNQHALTWVTDSENYSDGMYECNLCKKKAKCADGRWACKDCGYNICPKCKTE